MEPIPKQPAPDVTSSKSPSANAGSALTEHREAPESCIDDGASLSSTSDSEKADDPPGPKPDAITYPPRGFILKWFAADLQPPVQWERVLRELRGLSWSPTSSGHFYPNTLGPVYPVSLCMSCKGMKNLFHLTQQLLHISVCFKLEGWNALPHMLEIQRSLQACEFNCFTVLEGPVPWKCWGRQDL